MLVNLKTILLLAHICALCLAYKYEPKTGQWYKFHTEGARWTDANRTCVSEGAHLAIINSPAEAQVLKDLHQEHLDRIHDADWTYWVAIGIYRDLDLNTEHRSIWATNVPWKTVDGQTLEQAGYSSWFDDNPLPHPKMRYGYIMPRSTRGTLFSFNDDHTAPFICEK